MELDVGAHCAVASCHQLDFLPFVCDLCEKAFCLDHRTYAAHSCPKADDRDCRVILCPICKNSVKIVHGEDVNVTFDRHRASPECKQKEKKKRCPVTNCKEKLTFSNTFDCPKCKKSVCLTHRFDDAHECIKTIAPTAHPQIATGGQPRRRKGFFACLTGLCSKQ